MLPGAAGNLASPYSLALGGVTVPAANILYAGISPCCAGFYQIDFTVPSGTPSRARLGRATRTLLLPLPRPSRADTRTVLAGRAAAPVESVQRATGGSGRHTACGLV